MGAGSAAPRGVAREGAGKETQPPGKVSWCACELRASASRGTSVSEGESTFSVGCGGQVDEERGLVFIPPAGTHIQMWVHVV